MHIRFANPDDAPRLAQLRWEFRSVGHGEVEERQVEFEERCAAWMRSRLSSSGPWSAWVAEDNGEIVGQIWVQAFDKLPNPTGELEQHAYISNLYVTLAARGGIGTRLLTTCLEWLEDRGIDRVLLWPSARSRSLYERHGFHADEDVFERRADR